MKYFITAYKLLFTIAVFTISITAKAQDLLKGADLSTFRVEQVSDADIAKLKVQLEEMGISEAQAEQLALAKGMPASEIQKLKARLMQLDTKPVGNMAPSGKSAVVAANNANVTLNNSIIPVVKETSKSNRVFGAEIFENASLSFEPNLKISAPQNYELGTDDVIQVLIYGIQEARYELPITNEGFIYIPNAGLIRLAGLTLEAATQKINQVLAAGPYGTLKNGSSKLSVTLSRVKSIRVTILGAQKPGTYTISSLGTVFHALYLSGGPNATGSYRKIELIRNNKIIRVIDLYKLLAKGTLIDNVQLRDNDVIRIPAFDNRVELVGEVKRAGLFELLANETFNDLVAYAQGYTSNAYKASIKVITNTDLEKKVEDISKENFASYTPKNGDQITVGSLLDRLKNRVTIIGAVFRPGEYAVTPNLTVNDLLKKAEGLKDEAYLDRGILIRENKDLTKSVISFNVKDVVEGRTLIALQRNDLVQISAIPTLANEQYIYIEGEVKKPGRYAYFDSMTLKDAIILSDGFTDLAFGKQIEIARFIKRDSLSNTDVRISDVITMSDTVDLLRGLADITLKSKDMVIIKQQPGYMLPKTVFAKGEIQLPGKYAIKTRNEKVSDLLQRIGGFTPEADIDGAYIQRRKQAGSLSEDVRLQTVKKIQDQLKDSTGAIVKQVSRPVDQIPLNIAYIQKNPGSKEDIFLEDGDVFYIPKKDPQVKVTGEVMFPTQIPYDNKLTVKSYINAAGGFTEDASMKRVYVLYANGKAAVRKNYLLFRTYPKVKPGSEIIVPRPNADTRPKRSLQENIAITSAVASLAAVVIALINVIR